MSDVWSPPEGASPASSPASAIEGRLPTAMELAGQVFEDLKAHFAEYLLAGLGVQIVVLPLVFLVVGVYLASIIPGIVLNDDRVVFLGVFAGVSVAMFLIMFVTAPLTWGTSNAMWRWIKDKEPLSFGSAYRYALPGVGAYFVYLLLLIPLSMLGVLACYVGALAVSLFAHMALPGMVVHRLSPTKALSQSFAAVRANPSWHLAHWALGLVALLVAAYVPVLGQMLAVPLYASWQLLGYRAVFGDGEEPRALAA